MYESTQKVGNYLKKQKKGQYRENIVLKNRKRVR